MTEENNTLANVGVEVQFQKTSLMYLVLAIVTIITFILASLYIYKQAIK